ncbi:MAG: hypothetical protein Q7V57_13905 [Actinomycetota bacterium]|nr:hypothetical protein [Actinomycetota bacterium]
MGYYTRMSQRVVVGVPLTAALLGGAAGWLTRDQGTYRSSSSAAAGATLPEQLDAAAPFVALPARVTTQVIDPAAIIGFTPAPAIPVPAGAVVDLPLTEGRTASPVDAVTHDAATPAADRPIPVGQPVMMSALPAIGDTPSTQPPADTTTTIEASGDDVIDVCLLVPDSCMGAPGSVRDQPATATGEPAALRVSVPFAAAGALAELCSTIEGGTVPDSRVASATRPTLALVVNQPSTIAISGAWADGSALEKLTLVTSPLHDEEWRQTMAQQGVQRDILACITLSLDDVRGHAVGGIAELHADVLAISATGRAQSAGEVVINIPAATDDQLFAERVTISDAGERPTTDGVLYPTVHLHYAFFTDAVLPAGSPLTAETAHVYGSHAFVEGADCAGWAGNQQGRDRTHHAEYLVTTEQRSIAGETRPVTVVDADVHLDPTLSGGWQGHLCMSLVAADAAETASFTLAVEGATVRSPRTAFYEVGALLADSEFPADWQLRVMWSTADAPLCTPALLSNAPGGAAGATCGTAARLAPTGIVLSFVAVDTRGADRPAAVARIPVNLGYCNLDDPYAWLHEGCDPGGDQAFDITYGLPNGGTLPVHVVVHVGRSAAPGALDQDPSNSWQIGAPQEFAH